MYFNYLIDPCFTFWQLKHLFNYISYIFLAPPSSTVLKPALANLVFFIAPFFYQSLFFLIKLLKFKCNVFTFESTLAYGMCIQWRFNYNPTCQLREIRRNNIPFHFYQFTNLNLREIFFRSQFKFLIKPSKQKCDHKKVWTNLSVREWITLTFLIRIEWSKV